MPSKIKIEVSGQAGKDAELRQPAGKKEFAAFPVAVSNSRKLPDGTWENLPATWLNVMAYQNQNAIIQSVKKGTGVIVTGKPIVQAYTRKDTGEPAASITILADQVSVMLYDKKDTSSAPDPYSNIDPNMIDISEDSDVPF